MVGVAQLVELRIVIPAVVGSSPIVHPIPSVIAPLCGRSCAIDMVDDAAAPAVAASSCFFEARIR
jgi:hypothetical protein